VTIPHAHKEFAMTFARVNLLLIIVLSTVCAYAVAEDAKAPATPEEFARVMEEAGKPGAA
jgi:hypothetical protein